MSDGASSKDGSRSLVLAEHADANLGTSSAATDTYGPRIISVWGVRNMCDMFVSMCAQALNGLLLIIHYYFSE